MWLIVEKGSGMFKKKSVWSYFSSKDSLLSTPPCPFISRATGRSKTDLKLQYKTNATYICEPIYISYNINIFLRFHVYPHCCSCSCCCCCCYRCSVCLFLCSVRATFSKLPLVTGVWRDNAGALPTPCPPSLAPLPCFPLCRPAFLFPLYAFLLAAPFFSHLSMHWQDPITAFIHWFSKYIKKQI